MTKSPILWVLLLAAALRVGLLVCAWNHPAGVQTPDTRGYIALSDDLMQGRFGADSPEIFRTPGYPLFLLAGLPAGPLHWWKLVLIVQVLLDLLLVCLTYRLAKAMFDERVGLWAASFQATSAVAIAASTRLLSDGLFAMLLTFSLLLFSHYWKSARRLSLALCAAVLAAACYVRPTGQVFAAILAMALFFRAISNLLPLRRDHTGKSSASASDDCPPRTGLLTCATFDFLLFVVLGAALISPWIIRNALRADFVGFSSFATDSMFVDAVPEVLSRLPDGEDFAGEAGRQHMRDLDLDDDLVHGPRTPGQAARFRRDYAISVIEEYPWLYARLHLKGVVGFFLPGATDVLEVAGLSYGQKGTSDVLRKDGVLAAAKFYFQDDRGKVSWPAVAIAAVFVLIAAVQYVGVALFVFRPSRHRGAGFIGWLFFSLIIVASLLPGPYGFPRYQMMIVPLLSLFAAAGFCRRMTSKVLVAKKQRN